MRTSYLLFIVALSLSFNQNKIFAENNPKSLSLKTSDIKYAKFNINKISTFIYNNGEADNNTNGNSGFIYPKGTNGGIVYESGVVWGAKVNGEIRVGGSTYISGLQPGKIIGDGSAENPTSDNVRVFRVRPDYETADLSNEASDENLSISEIKEQYQKDWYEWPADKGAPFNDKNNNNIYEPDIDIPGVPGADQTLWFVANDLDSNKAKELYGSTSMGIEVQVTIWGYSNADVLENMLFKRYVLINKSKNDFENMYVSLWHDPDLGDAGDDFVGCDTTLNLGYVYNGDDNDWTFNDNIPSFGIKILQGPIVPGKFTDTATFLSRKIDGFKNLSMTSFPWFGKNSPEYNSPNLGDYELGTLHFYNIMQGIGSSLGNYTINPLTGKADIFVFSGNPVTGEGWLNGMSDSPGDKRLTINSGPFTMAVGDTQEVIFAQIVAGGGENTDRLEAVKLLKQYTYLAEDSYKYNFELKSKTIPSLTTVEKTELDREIILSWYDDPNLDLIEETSLLSYNFQGYNVYQYPNVNFNISEAKLISTYDIIDGITKIDKEDNTNYIEINGNDKGIKRHISILRDTFNTEKPLNNGKEYFFGITAYGVNSKYNFYPHVIESEPYKIIAIPQSDKPGYLYEGEYYQEIDAIQTVGTNNNIPLNIRIINPTKLQNKTYNVVFNVEGELNDSTFDNIYISIYDDENNVIFPKSKITLADEKGLAKPIYFDGLAIEPFDIKTYDWQPLIISDGDVLSFTTPKTIINDKELAKEQIKNINVFPNPYYGKHENEVNQYEKYITFNHLPNKATIRIFNLAGQHIITLKKDDNSQFLRWDLTNGKNFWVPSGIYIAYIDLPELNSTKILKIALIRENIVPDYF